MKGCLMGRIREKIKRFIKLFGPGFLTGAADDDPSGIGTYSMAGAKYGLKMAWLVPFQLPMMFAIQEMCARIGLKTGKGLATNMKEHFPLAIVYPAIAVLIFANIVNIGADIAIMGSCCKMVFGLSDQVWTLIVTLLCIIMQVFISYKMYTRILLWFSGALIAYAITAFMVTPSWWEVIQSSFTPHMILSKDFILVATGFIGTTISPYLFFWQTSQEIEDLGDNENKIITQDAYRQILRKMRIQTFIGMVFSQLIALFIVVTCYYTLHAYGITEITSAADAALALRPLVGEWAYLLFSLGIIGAGLLGIPVLAGSVGYALSDLLHKKASLAATYKEAPFFYLTITLVTLAGSAITFFLGNPVQALLYAAIVNAIAAVPFIVFIILLANKKSVVQEHKNKTLANIGGGVTLLVMMLTAAILIGVSS